MSRLRRSAFRVINLSQGTGIVHGRVAVPHIPPPATDSMKTAATLLNRELSLLAFNRRVLSLAADGDVPLLERLRFLCILGSNLDEFFEIRVAGIKEQLRSGHAPAGMTAPAARALLRQIGVEVRALIAEQYRLLNDDVLPALARKRVHLVRRTDFSAAESEWVARAYERDVRPLLTPIGLDPAHPFPQVVNKSLNFIVELAGNDAFGRETSIAIVKAPRVLPRLMKLPVAVSGNDHSFVMLSSVIHAHLDTLFPGRRVVNYAQFRVTRDADLWIDEEEVKNLRQALQGELGQRHYGAAVRLEVPTGCPERLASFLLQQFELTEDDLYRCDGPVNIARLAALIDDVDLDELKYEPFEPGNSRRAAPRAGHPRRDPCWRRPAAPSLPVVRAGRRVHPPCRRRSRRPVDQADGLPHRRQLGADGGADRGRALRQGGHRRHRTDGALRRGDQHQLGGPARAGRRPGRLRGVRAQDPRQARPAVAPGNRPARPGAPGPVRPPRHRQLPPADDAPVHRLRAPDLRSRRLRRRRGRVHAHHQSRAGGTPAPAAAGAVHDASADHRQDPPGSPARPRRKAGLHHGQDERTGRGGRDPRALRGVAGRRADRPRRPRCLRAAARRAGPVGQHPRALDPRALSSSTTASGTSPTTATPTSGCRRPTGWGATCSSGSKWRSRCAMPR